MKSKYYVEQHRMYYPSGGMGDMTGPYDSIVEAQKAADLSYDFITIWVVDNNEIKYCCMWHGTNWKYAEGVQSPHAPT